MAVSVAVSFSAPSFAAEENEDKKHEKKAGHSSNPEDKEKDK